MTDNKKIERQFQWKADLKEMRHLNVVHILDQILPNPKKKCYKEDYMDLLYNNNKCILYNNNKL